MSFLSNLFSKPAAGNEGAPNLGNGIYGANPANLQQVYAAANPGMGIQGPSMMDRFASAAPQMSQFFNQQAQQGQMQPMAPMQLPASAGIRGGPGQPGMPQMPMQQPMQMQPPQMQMPPQGQLPNGYRPLMPPQRLPGLGW